MKNKKNYCYLLFFVFLIPFVPSHLSCIAQNTETFTILTYYPSPYVIYNVLRLTPNDENTPGAACTARGEMYYDNSDGRIYVCTGSPFAAWQSFSDNWTLSGSSLYPGATPVTAWNVGIGTSSAPYTLTINGTIHSAKPLTNGMAITDAKVIFYDYTGSNPTNWAGLGVNTSGDIWIRTGIDANHYTIIKADGSVAIDNAAGPASGYKLDVNGKIRAANLRAVRTTVTGCNNETCSYSVTIPGTTLINSAICNSFVSNISNAPLVNCQPTSIAPSGSNTIVGFRLSREPNSAQTGWGLLSTCSMEVDIIGFQP